MIAGGYDNTAVAVGGTILGGMDNTVHFDPNRGRNIGKGGVVGSGTDNEALGNQGVVLSGFSSEALGQHHSTLGSGVGNYARGSWSTVVSGGRNQAGANFASVLGGYQNKANSRFATVIGGSRNTVHGYRSAAIGHRNLVTGMHSFAFSLETGNHTCVVTTDRTVSFCAGSVNVNGDDIESLFSRRELAATETEQLTKMVGDHRSAVEELRAQIKAREATIEQLLGRVQEQELAALRTEHAQLLSLMQ